MARQLTEIPRHTIEGAVKGNAEENLNSGWVIMNGNRIRIKRRKFEKIIDDINII